MLVQRKGQRKSRGINPRGNPVWWKELSFSLECEVPWLKSRFCYSLLVWTWSKDLTYLCLSFPTHNRNNEFQFLATFINVYGCSKCVNSLPLFKAWMIGIFRVQGECEYCKTKGKFVERFIDCMKQKGCSVTKWSSS